MARLVIVVDVDTDPAREDPHEVADELLYDSYTHKLTQYADCKTTFVSAEWED